MDPLEEISESLVKWLQALVTKGTKSLVEISDGVAMCHLLVQIAPEHFTKLESKLKMDSLNWRLRVSNLKKIVESIIEYYQDRLNLNILDVGKPDLLKIGETSNLIELGKLLRLILGCAVNCERKQEYITKIMALEESVQQCIMQAIQQLEEVTGNTGRSGLSLISMESDSRIFRLMQDLEAANESKEVLAQRCHNLETQLQCLLEEQQTIAADNRTLTNLLKERETTENVRSPDNRKQVELLKEEIFKLETSRDDFRAKTIEQDKQIINLEEKISTLQVSSDAAARLKDEVDALSESASKVEALEQVVAAYKKKLEAHGDIKKQLSILQEKNVEYYQLNLKYEEELENILVWKNQCEVYKKQAADLQLKLDEEIERADRVTYQMENLKSKYALVTGERDRITQERDSLREENEELKLGKEIKKSFDEADVAQELTPTDMVERLRFLEKDNRALRVASQDATSKQALLDDSLNRIEKLIETNRNINQKVVELEEQLEEQQKLPRDDQALNTESSLKEYKQKVFSLQELLTSKENELQLTQTKYLRNLEKAKQVAQNLEIKSSDGIESLRQNNMKEIENHMLTVAFYRLSLTRHREAVDERLAMLSAGQGQSFLARQRQPMSRKPVHPFKSKITDQFPNVDLEMFLTYNIDDQRQKVIVEKTTGFTKQTIEKLPSMLGELTCLCKIRKVVEAKLPITKLFSDCRAA